VLAGFPDGLADEGVGAGAASLVGLEVARDNNWTAPADQRQGDEQPTAEHQPEATSDEPARGRQDSADAQANEPDELPGGKDAQTSPKESGQ
jgi:NADH-quinone oxidoreductase subunit E